MFYYFRYLKIIKIDYLLLDNYEVLYKIIILILCSGYIYYLLFNLVLKDNIQGNDLMKKYDITSKDNLNQGGRDGKKCDIFCEYKDGKINQRIAVLEVDVKTLFCFGSSVILKVIWKY